MAHLGTQGHGKQEPGNLVVICPISHAAIKQYHSK